MKKSNTSLKTTVEWQDIQWRSIERRVFKLQKRIYKAAERGDTKAVRRLQKTIANSWSAKLLAVRQVTQDNRGKKTAGIDGINNLRPEKRILLAKKLNLNGKSKATRRVWIPKNNGEKRALGIPTVEERAKQALMKLVLEPEWEAKFERNSYGFRLGRSCHDAIEAIFSAIKQKPKYVLDADIAKCFDKIDHEKLLAKINTCPKFRKQIKAWLKSGVIDCDKFFDTEEGTPQGGVIFPLLANIALHGMENDLKSQFRRRKIGMTPHGTQINSVVPDFIRYADNFVILHHDLQTLEKCKEFIEGWLENIGLELKGSKTRITHTLEEIRGNVGFDFLGFHVRQFKVSERLAKQGFKTIITPSQEAVRKHLEAIHKVIYDLNNASQENLIRKLNPIVRGWCNYYSTCCAKETFSKVEHLMQIKLRRWAERRHPNKGRKWVINKYWHTVGADNWVFSTTEHNEVIERTIRHNQTPIKRHILVKGSPYNGDWVYWSKRTGKSQTLSTSKAKLMKKQNGKCAHCGLYFKLEDVIEIDHIEPVVLGGRQTYNNLQLLHGHCHDVKTRTDGSCIRDKDCVTEERNEAKVSRSVLKTSSFGDRIA